MDVNLSAARKAVKACGGSSWYQKLRNGWERLFVKGASGSSIGRLSFHFGVLKNVKCYKRDSRSDFDETDEVFFRLEHFFETGGCRLLSLEDFFSLRENAQQMVDQHFSRCVDWRMKNSPAKKRRKLKKKNVRSVLRILVFEDAALA